VPLINHDQPSPALTLIELLIVIAIIAIIGATTSPVYSNFLARNHYRSKISEVASSLSTARTNAIAGRGDSDWGVSLSSSQITLFKGSSFAARDSGFDQTYTVPSVVTFSGLSEIVFTRPHGYPTTTGSITISSNTSDSTSFTINQFGSFSVN